MISREDFEQLVLEVIEALSKTEDIRILESAEKELLKYDVTLTYIELDSAFLNPEGTGTQLRLHLMFPRDFPMVMPRVILPQQELEKYRYYPHVEPNAVICTFDPDVTRPNPKDPIGVTKMVIRRAKDIMSAGMGGINAADYEQEFRAYWAIRYGDEVENKMLCLFTGAADPERLELVKLNEVVEGFDYLVHNGDADALQFMDFVNGKNITYQQLPICYLGEIPFDFRPPFNLRNADVKRMVKKLSAPVQSKFKSFINSKTENKFVCATVKTGGVAQFIGWFHKPIAVPKKVNGWRKGEMTAYELLSGKDSGVMVTRELPSVFCPDQKQLRTDGSVAPKIDRKKFAVAGLGSIGSNLIGFLNAYNETEFRLVDMDLLSKDNVNRHFLGFGYLNFPKVEGMKHYLVEKNPFQKVLTSRKSVITLALDDPGFLNESDYMFLVTGKANVNTFLADLQRNGQLNKPIFILWVEPYLSAGHLVYLHPQDADYRALFDADEYFKHNAILKDEYINENPHLSLKEAGCQTSYMPYGQLDVTLFLSAIFPFINAIVEGDVSLSSSFSWYGNLERIQKMGIRLDGFITMNMQYTVIKHE